ncbi:MAG: PBP1A family penicillin-binding protein [Nitrospirae bacterium]|nr:PBP1A family penicillin-binding protein [Nitrospirota bacterium]MBI3352393.1 PBP1A family penicillin-binding protein [Nitrospirota bacterium]
MRKKVKKYILIYLAVSLSFLTYIFYLKIMITTRIEGKKWNLPSKVYSAPFGLYPGQTIEGSHIFPRLERLGYHLSSGKISVKGDYSVQGDQIIIYLHDFPYPEEPFQGYVLRLEVDRGKISRISRSDNLEDIYFQEMEPELIAGFFENSWEERMLIKLDEIPPSLVQAVIAIEDERFYQHHGIDVKSILRAFLTNIRSNQIVQGGSTLTQQLVKNFFLNQKRTLTRKINEALMALILEAQYSKKQILETYLNEIYWGQKGSVGIFGIGKAAQFYFARDVKDLTLGESALLAGIIRAPNHLDPHKNFKKAVERKNVVLKKMLDLRLISGDDYRKAVNEKIQVRESPEGGHSAPFFADLVRQQLSSNYSSSVLNTDGLRIYTTLDVEMQKMADETLKKNLNFLEKTYPHLKHSDPSRDLEGCLIAVSPHTGHVVALVGGKNYQINQFNRATQAHRQPGSIFKPLVYLTAFEQTVKKGPSPNSITPATLLDDSPVTLTLDDKSWSPQNYDQTFHGLVTVRKALENSMNVPTVKLALTIGLDAIIQTARSLGIESLLRPNPSLALGSYEVTPFEIISAYTVLANQGMKTELQTIKMVTDSNGKILEGKNLEVTAAVSPQAAFLVTYLLKGVVENGTAKKIRESGFQRPAAGKTGTTNDYNDAWFVGYTPDLLTLVWVGFDQGEKLNLTGASAALPIWVDFMKEALEEFPYSDFTLPSKIRFEKIVPSTGLKWAPECGPEVIEEAFFEGTEPLQSCLNDGKK